MSDLIPDLRSALKALMAARGFTALAVLTLGVGLALCVTVLTVVNAYMVRALPYPASDRLFRVDYAAPNQRAPRGLEQLEWASLHDVVEFPVSWDLDVFYILGREYPESMPGGWVTPDPLRRLSPASAARCASMARKLATIADRSTRAVVQRIIARMSFVDDADGCPRG